MEKEYKNITIHQGKGDSELEMTVQVTQEELDRMEQLRRFSPEKWEGKDLELLRFVRDLIKTEADKVQQASIEEKKEKKKQRLRMIIGIIALLCLVIRIITYTLSKHYKEETQQVFKDHPELMNDLLNKKEREQFQHHINTEEFLSKVNGIFFDEIYFQYPMGWSFEDQSKGRVKHYYGCNQKENKAITYSWKNGTISYTADELLKNARAELKSYGNVRFGEIKEIIYSSYNAVTQNYILTHEGETIFGQIICIVLKDSACTIAKMAESEKDLASDDFKLMDSTFRMPILPIRTD